MSNHQPSPRVLIFEASAGSGKTYCLANHYLKLLLSSDSPGKQIENILAITFTNKAAREMKERILELLKKIALNAFSDTKEEREILKELGFEKKVAQVKAAEAMEYIINHYHFFQIKTIDSFINMILLGCAFRLGLSANFKIKDDRLEYLTFSLDECIDRAHYDKETKRRFDAFLHQYLYLEEKSSWLPKSDILAILGSLFHHANIYGGNFKKSTLTGAHIVKDKRALLDRIKTFSLSMPPDVHGTFRRAIERFVSRYEENFDFEEFANKKSFLSDELPVIQEGKVSPQIESAWRHIREEIKALAAKEAYSLFNCYIDIFDMVYEVFRLSAHKDDVLFLEELNKQARTLINENGVTVPERYYGLAARLKHFLIDEFQDTSILQWNNLYPMVAETLSTGGSLFYVGDKKQAIFRFRGGEVELFNSIRDEFSAYVQQEALKINYRSQKAIVDFNNSVFDQENVRRFLKEQQPVDDELKVFDDQDTREILDIFSNARQAYKNDETRAFGFVCVEEIIYRNSEEKNVFTKEKLLSLIARLKEERGFSFKDIAVLLRDNADVELVSGWLIEKGVMVESEKTLNVKNNPYVKEIISLLTFLNSPIDNLSFASFLLGDIFSKATGLSKEAMHDFLFSIKEKTRGEQGFYIYREFKKNYSKVWDIYIEGLFNRVGFIPVYELVIEMYKKFRVFEYFGNAQGFLMHFLELIKESEKEYLGIADFLLYLETLKDQKLYVNSSDTEAVRVMTIHKAKGLGFGVVIIPFLEFDTASIGSMDKKSNVSYCIEQRQETLCLLRLDKKYASLSPLVRGVFKQEYKKSFIDELNTVYVATTRAKNELYIFLPSKSAKTNSNRVLQLIPQAYRSFGGEREYGREAAVDHSPLNISSPEYREWVDFIKEEFQDVSTVRHRQSILRGSVLHAVLSCIGNLSEVDKETSLQKGFARAKTLFPFVNDFSYVETVIRKVVESKDTKTIFYCADKQVYQEKEVVDSLGLTKRIDGLMINDTEAWIVDYKTKEELSLAYYEQVTYYMGLLAQMYPRRKIRGFILFLEDCRIEEING